MTPGAPGRSRRSDAWILAGLAALLFLPSVWTRGLWNPDEPRYAECVREMRTAGDFILPHLNGAVYSEKPPLFFWLSLAAEAIPGIPRGAGGRLVAAAAGLATLLLTHRIGAILADGAAGLLAAALLATALTFWQLAQSGVIDALLTVCCAAAVLAFLRHRAGARWGMPAFYGACAAGVLAKGPVGLLVPGLAALSFSVAESGLRGLRAAHPLWGIPLAAAPAAAWLAAAAAGRGGTAYVETMVVRQNVGRALDAFVHKAPFWYFLLVFPPSFLPWIVVLPHAVAAAVRERLGAMRPARLPLAWFASTFVLFSLVSGKKTRYLLPLFPAAALLVAIWMMRRMTSRDGRIASGRGAWLLACASGILLASFLAAPALGGAQRLPASWLSALREPGSEAALAAVEAALAWPRGLAVLLPAVLFGAACAWAGRLAWERRVEAVPAFLAGWTILLLAAGWLWSPVVDDVKSARGLADAIRREAPGAPLYYLRDIHEAALNFYLERDRIPLLRRAAELRAAAADPRARFIGARDEIRRMGGRAGVPLDPVACRRVGEDVLCLAAPAASPAPDAPGPDRARPSRAEPARAGR